MRPNHNVHLASLIFLSQAYALPQPAIIDKKASDDHALNRQRADSVKQTFQIAWNGYQKYAFPNDELHPISNSFGNPRNGWGASAVDAFDTAIIMQLPDIVDTILEYIPTINYDATSSDVSLFETTIRYLGGMLSGYDLLTGPFSHLASNGTAVKALLTQSKRLADNLKFAFDSPTGIPRNNLNLALKSSGDGTNGLATIGTLILEWTRLSDLTGDPQYAELSKKGESYLLSPKYNTPLSSPWPGLLGTNVNVTTGLFVDASGGWNANDDSYYEYLIKMYVYDSSKYAAYKDAWIEAADSTIAHLASHPSTRPDLTFVAAFNGQTLNYDSGHLACFDGGNFLLGGIVLNEQKYIDFGLALVTACEATYASTLTLIGPEGFGWSVNGTEGVPADQIEFYKKAGFYITSSAYILRPEVLESFYYAYRVTGDQKYREWAWNGYLAINKTTRAGSGYAEILNVNTEGGGAFYDVQDSFFLAEVLKYAYLIHSPDGEWQVNNRGNNKWVFNTEAHPFKVVGPPV